MEREGSSEKVGNATSDLGLNDEWEGVSQMDRREKAIPGTQPKDSWEHGNIWGQGSLPECTVMEDKQLGGDQIWVEAHPDSPRRLEYIIKTIWSAKRDMY